MPLFACRFHPHSFLAVPFGFPRGPTATHRCHPAHVFSAHHLEDGRRQRFPRSALPSVPRPPAKKRCIHRKQIHTTGASWSGSTVSQSGEPPSSILRDQGSALIDTGCLGSLLHHGIHLIHRFRHLHLFGDGGLDTLCVYLSDMSLLSHLNLFDRNLPALVTSESGGGVCVIS